MKTGDKNQMGKMNDSQKAVKPMSSGWLAGPAGRQTIFLLALALAWLAAVPALAGMARVQDMAGRQVQVSLPVKKIACLGPGALRLIVYLQAQDLVAGVEAMEKRFASGRPYWLAHPELARLPVIGPGGAAAINKKPDMEALLKVAPDLVFVTYMDAALADRIQAVLAKPVVVLSYGTLATFDQAVEKSLRLAGSLLGRGKRAAHLVSFMRRLQAELKKRSRQSGGAARPGAYVGGIGYKGAHDILSTDNDYLPLKWLEITNLAGKIPSRLGSHVFVDRETLLKLNPEVIFIDAGGLELVRADFEKRPGFYQALGAFAAGRVHLLFPFNYYTTNIETAYIDAFAIGKVVCPAGFGDLDLRQQADRIYSFMVGRPVYRQMEASYGQLGRKPAFLEKR